MDFEYISLTLDQTKIVIFPYRNLKSKETDPDGGKLHSFWTHPNVPLIATMTAEMHRHCSFGA